MDEVKTWLEIPVWNNTVLNYAVAAVSSILIVLAFMLAKRLIVRDFGGLAAKNADDFGSFLVGLVAQTGSIVFIVIVLYLAVLPLELEERVRAVFRYALVIVVTVRAIFLIQEVIRYSVGKSYRRARPDDPSANAVIRNVTNVTRWALWGLGAVFVLDNLGINISALVAGLGIGGVAVAMASQAVLGDLFSALSIFVDKPFEV